MLGGIGGVVFWGGFNTYMEYTNTLGFCVSCHEMGDFVYQEYGTSAHFKNASGVRVRLCRLSRAEGLDRQAAAQDPGDQRALPQGLGTISTPEKFEAKRLELAERVWAR